MKRWTCPSCGYDASDNPLDDWDICPCCGTEFYYHDEGRDFAAIRQEWIAGGMKWWDPVMPAPKGWNALEQLIAFQKKRLGLE